MPRDDEIRDAKRLLRKRLRGRRADVPEAAIAAAGEAILERLTSLAVYRETATIHTYVGALPGEIPTRPLIAAALASGKRVVCPRVLTLDPPVLQHLEIASVDDLERSALGLWEPVARADRMIPLEQLDVVVVPGLGFDRRGHRLGMGGGFYDRFLACVDAPRLALALSLQVVDAIPHTERDVRVDGIVTERAFIDCRATPGGRQDGLV